MSVDNRTTLNDGSSTGGWNGDDSVAVTTSFGDSYQGGSALTTQLSNSYEHMYTTSIGGTRNLADVQIWDLIKDNLIDTEANGGSQIVLHDGTDRVGYGVGGNDATGLQLPTFYNSYRLDTSNLPSFSNVYAGNLANLTLTAITGVGYGTRHLAKAVGSVDNTYMDRFCFIANGSPALTINGGTSGTPEGMSDVVADDITNGWGLVANPKGKQFDVFCATEFGDSGTTESYFEQKDAQIFFLGQGLGVGNFDQKVIANSTGTNSFVLDNCAIINIGTKANWEFNVADHDILKITNSQYVGGGDISLPTIDNTNKFITDTIFDDHGVVTVRTLLFERNIIKGGSSILLSSTSHQVKSCAFISGGSGPAVTCDTAGTYTWDGNTDSGYSGTRGSNNTASSGDANAMFFNDSGGLITINVINGGQAPSVRNGANSTTVVNDSRTFTVNGLIANQSEVRVRDGAVTLTGGSANPVTSSTFVMTFNALTTPNDVTLSITTPGYDYETRKIQLHNQNIIENITLTPDASWVP